MPKYENFDETIQKELIMRDNRIENLEKELGELKGKILTMSAAIYSIREWTYLAYKETEKGERYL